MASVKLIQLAVRTLAKPIATQLKTSAKEHPAFRNATISFAQFLHRQEMQARVSLFSEKHPKVRRLNDETAIEKGANFISEAFLFAVAAGLILGETIRSSRSTSKRRDAVDDQLAALREELTQLRAEAQTRYDRDHQELEDVANRDLDVARVVDHLVDVLRRTASLERHFSTDTVLQRDSQALHTAIAAAPPRVQRPRPSAMDKRTEEVATLIVKGADENVDGAARSRP